MYYLRSGLRIELDYLLPEPININCFGWRGTKVIRKYVTQRYNVGDDSANTFVK